MKHRNSFYYIFIPDIPTHAYTGTLVWGANAKDGAPPVRVEDAHPAIVSRRDFRRARRLLGSRAPKKVNLTCPPKLIQV